LDKGKADGITGNTIYEIVKKGRSVIRSEGIGLDYEEDDVVGNLTISLVDEEVSSGLISRKGFFDRVTVGDEIILQTQKTAPPESGASVADPELRRLLQTLR
jgi:hypothetical protein